MSKIYYDFVLAISAAISAEICDDDQKICEMRKQCYNFIVALLFECYKSIVALVLSAKWNCRTAFVFTIFSLAKKLKFIIKSSKISDISGKGKKPSLLWFRKSRFRSQILIIPTIFLSFLCKDVNSGCHDEGQFWPALLLDQKLRKRKQKQNSKIQKLKKICKESNQSIKSLNHSRDR